MTLIHVVFNVTAVFNTESLQLKTTKECGNISCSSRCQGGLQLVAQPVLSLTDPF